MNFCESIILTPFIMRGSWLPPNQPVNSTKLVKTRSLTVFVQSKQWYYNTNESFISSLSCDELPPFCVLSSKVGQQTELYDAPTPFFFYLRGHKEGKEVSMIDSQISMRSLSPYDSLIYHISHSALWRFIITILSSSRNHEEKNVLMMHQWSVLFLLTS